MQNLLRNPLASPYTLGVSSGASFGAALAMVLGIDIFVFLVAKFSRNNMSILVLTGTAINSLFSAGVSILKYASRAEGLKNLDTWLMGGFWKRIGGL